MESVTLDGAKGPNTSTSCRSAGRPLSKNAWAGDGGKRGQRGSESVVHPIILMDMKSTIVFYKQWLISFWRTSEELNLDIFLKFGGVAEAK
jgi:hypothetical protein